MLKFNYLCCLLLVLLGSSAQLDAQCTVIANALPACAGEEGALQIDVNGIAPYNLQWSGPETGNLLITNTQAILPELATGTYSITLTDALQCTSVTSVTLGNIAAPIVNIAGLSSICPPENLIIQSVDEVAGYTYAWSNGTTTSYIIEPVTASGPVTYTVTVTNTAGCSATASKTIQVYQQPQILGPSTYCSEGGVSLSVSTTGISYRWNFGDTTSAVFVKPTAATTYTVEVTYASGCKSTSPPFTVTPPVTATSVSELLNCTFVSIDLTPVSASGNSNFTYLWSTGETTQDIDSTFGDIQRFVTITDAQGCSINFMPLYTGLLFKGWIQTTQMTCNVPNSGSATIVHQSGVAPYQYLWSNGATTSQISGLSKGFYLMTVTDANGCTQTSSTYIHHETPEVIMSTYPVTCGGIYGDDGSITITITGTQTPYTYQWSNGSTIRDQAALSSGFYTVTVTNAAGCTRSYTVPVGQLAQSSLDWDIITTPANCGQENGQTEIVINSGVGPHNFEWSGDGNGFGYQQLNIPPGTYQVTATDGNDCHFTQTFEILAVGDFNIIPQITPDSCGAGKGSISLGVSGGVAPYTYAWSNNISTQVISGLFGNLSYTVTITDATGCILSKTYSSGNIAGFSTNSAVVPISCNGLNNASINLSVTGGTMPYTFTWSNGATSSNLSQIGPGAYQSTITDASGCHDFFQYTITEPDELTMEFAWQSVTCFGGSNGALYPNPLGGTAPFSYNWAHIAGGSDPSEVYNLSSGLYTLTITDANGCSATDQFFINQPSALQVGMPVFDQSCGNTLVQLPLPTGGWAPYNYHWSNGATTQNIYVQTSGTYTVSVKDLNNCVIFQSFVVDVIPVSSCTEITGYVVQDDNDNCINDAEPGLVGWIIQATSTAGQFYTVSQNDGAYSILVPASNTYNLDVISKGDLWIPCPPAVVNALPGPGVISGIDLPVQYDILCADMEVHLASSNLRRCFDTNVYHIAWCNNGTDAAQNAYILLETDLLTTPLTSTVPFSVAGDHVYRFELGDVGAFECGSFSFTFNISCNAINGQALCAEAHIYPDSICLPPAAQWSGASLELSSTCLTDSLVFTITNVGTAPMSGALEYIVVEDHVMLIQNPIQLSPTEIRTIAVPANGSTWRLQVPQEPFHPGNSMPSLTVEGCTPVPPFSLGYVTQYALDESDTWIDIECREITGSYDPNDKTGYPIGYGAEHYIEPNTPIEYVIRFQNTGNDTAFTVVITDTLSAWLNPATIRPGASSHPYTFDLSGEGTVRFRFENILLPDSNTNVLASQGFIQFSILPDTTAPLETLVENKASIYFDFNDPIITNTTRHRLGRHFITVGLWEPMLPQYTVQVAPNPSSGNAWISVQGLEQTDELLLTIFGADGKVLAERTGDQGVFQLDGLDLSTGTYWIQVTRQATPIGSGTIIIQNNR